MLSDELVMGRFRLGERIGSGGMGTVYRAFDERLQRTVAVKEIQAAGADRVLREAQAAARLNHPAIVTLYELGERDGHALLVSEYVEGRTLDRMARDGSVSDRDVAEIGADLCEALEHAHSRGVVHRDVKPQNAIVRPWDSGGRRAKLMDFGIAAVAGSPGLTATGEVIGTLAYMAPEQAEGHGAGPEADVYSLALTLYEAWAGHNPVAGGTPAQTARQIGRPVPTLAESRPDLPESLIARVDACLEPDPHARPTLAQLRASLAKAASRLDDECAVPAPDDVEVIAARRSPARVASVVAIAVALAALAGPVGMPGAALVLACLLLPVLALVPNAALAPVALLAIPLGAVGALAAAPALAALAAARTRDRIVLGAASFACYLAGALALGSGPRLGIAPPASDDWKVNAATAANEVLGPITQLDALAGMALLAAAAAVLGLVLRAHPAVALVGAMLWAAGLAYGLAAIGNGAQGESASLAVLAAGLAVACEAWRRAREAPHAEAAPATAQPVLDAHGAAALLP
jgi:eukaryotic-like serine/threonine-protein kinase